MLKIDDIIVYGELQDILNTLKSELALRGLHRFSFFRDGVDNIQTNCPFHKGGQERKPSFGINKYTGYAHCFTCGWSGTVADMISELFGKNDGGKFGKDWLLKRYNSVQVETRPNIVNMSNLRNSHRCHKSVVPEAELDSLRFVHPYMYERGLNDEIIEKFDVGYDRENEEITFPVLDLDGDCVFVASRSVRTKFFRLPQGKTKPVYQAYRFKSGEYKYAYITESFLNCLTCWKYGKPAMALIGTGNKYQYQILENLPVREYILALDPDDGGRRGAERFRKSVSGKIIKELKYTHDGEDINDLQEKFLDLEIIF